MADKGAANSFRIGTVGHIPISSFKRSDGRKGLTLISPLDDVIVRRREFAKSKRLQRRIRGPDHDDSVRLPVRKCPKQNCVHDTENRRVRTDAEREREHSHGGEAGVLQQHSAGVMNVLK